VKEKLSVSLTKHSAIRTYGGVEVWLHTFLTSALDGGEWSASRPSCCTPRERAPGIHCVGGRVGHNTGLIAVAKRKILTPVIQLVAETLYWLSYPSKQNSREWGRAVFISVLIDATIHYSPFTCDVSVSSSDLGSDTCYLPCHILPQCVALKMYIAAR
jgi:hypothetical protein